MNYSEKTDFDRISHSVETAITRILEKGADDVFQPPLFSLSSEKVVLSANPEAFREKARSATIKFLKRANLDQEGIGPTRRALVSKDENSFRQVAWLDPFDAVKYLATTYLLFGTIEKSRIPKEELVVHSHRQSTNNDELFDPIYGYDSFRKASSDLSRERIGKWKVVTDIANFFDRVGNHSLEAHLKDIGCEEQYVHLIKEMLYLWSGDRRSFGLPVGSDASRILSEVVLLNIDKKLKESGIVFVRYVDDFSRHTPDERLLNRKFASILSV